MTLAIETIGLGKRFVVNQGYLDLLPFRRRRRAEVLRSIDLQVQQGEVFGILGPNGAGKTTLFKILGTLILPTAGRARVMGLDVARQPKAVREVLTYVVSEERSLFWRLTGRQNLQFFAMLFEMPRWVRKSRIDELLTLVDLQEFADERVMKYSTGMRQSLAIARGLLSNPDILLLDEPTRSLDPVSARRLWEFIKGELAQRQGKTVVVATHNMEEAAHLCDRVAILHRGRVELCDAVPALEDRLTGRGRYEITVSDAPRSAIVGLGLLAGVSNVVAPPPNGLRQIDIELVVEEPEIHIPMVVEELVRKGGRVLNVEQTRRSLGDLIAGLAEERRS